MCFSVPAYYILSPPPCSHHGCEKIWAAYIMDSNGEEVDMKSAIQETHQDAPESILRAWVMSTYGNIPERA